MDIASGDRILHVCHNSKNAKISYVQYDCETEDFVNLLANSRNFIQLLSLRLGLQNCSMYEDQSTYMYYTYLFHFIYLVISSNSFLILSFLEN